MAEAKSKAETRKIEKQIEIAASPEAVWKALTDPQELTRWFPLEARVTPGLGGSIFVSWGPDCEGEAPITIWEPNHRYGWTEGPPGAEPAPNTVEWIIESRGGRTLVHVVNSGFTSGADWENEKFDSTEYGWVFMLVNLRHYLERHAGVPRQVAWPRKRVAVTRAEAYARVAGADGLLTSGAPTLLLSGSPYEASTAWGDRYTGRLEFVVATRGFCVTVKELNDALLWLTIEGVPGEHEVQLWLSAYGVPQADVDAFERHGRALLEKLFP